MSSARRSRKLLYETTDDEDARETIRVMIGKVPRPVSTHGQASEVHAGSIRVELAQDLVEFCQSYPFAKILKPRRARRNLRKHDESIKALGLPANRPGKPESVWEIPSVPYWPRPWRARMTGKDIERWYPDGTYT